MAGADGAAVAATAGAEADDGRVIAAVGMGDAVGAADGSATAAVVDGRKAKCA
jgi:hypothetical protein